MPTINRLSGKPRTSERDEHTPSRELRRKAYNSTVWRNLRTEYYKEHPLCEQCLKKGKVKPAESIHHVRSPFHGGEINWVLLTDRDNLMALCNECHGEIHGGNEKSSRQILEDLEKLLNGNEDR